MLYIYSQSKWDTSSVSIVPEPQITHDRGGYRQRGFPPFLPDARKFSNQFNLTNHYRDFGVNACGINSSGLMAANT